MGQSQSGPLRASGKPNFLSSFFALLAAAERPELALPWNDLVIKESALGVRKHKVISFGVLGRVLPSKPASIADDNGIAECLLMPSLCPHSCRRRHAHFRVADGSFLGAICTPAGERRVSIPALCEDHHGARRPSGGFFFTASSKKDRPDLRGGQCGFDIRRRR